MTGMPHTTEPASVPRLLKVARTASVPSRVTTGFLENNGFDHDEAPHLIGLLRAIGMVDKDAVPTTRWRQHRVPSASGPVIARAVRDNYKPIFRLLPTAQSADMTRLAEIVRGETSYAEPHVRQTVDTFMALCAEADFSTDPDGPTTALAVPSVGPPAMSGLVSLTRSLIEALHCVEHGLYRPAHVSAWNGLIATVLSMLAADGFSAVHELRPAWKVGNTDDLARRMSGAMHLDWMFQLGLCTDDERDSLDDLLRRRNDCAHPSDFEPTRDEALTYVTDVATFASKLAGRTS